MPLDSTLIAKVSFMKLKASLGSKTSFARVRMPSLINLRLSKSSTKDSMRPSVCKIRLAYLAACLSISLVGAVVFRVRRTYAKSVLADLIGVLNSWLIVDL